MSDWLTALGITLIINLTVALFRSVAIQRISKLAEQTHTRIDDALVQVVRATRQWLVLPVSLYLACHSLDLPQRVLDLLGGVATVAAFLQLGLWGATALDFWFERYRARAALANPGATTSLVAMTFVARLLLWTLVLLLALDNLGIDVTALVAGLGIGGIAVALAVQNVLGDLLASLSIVMDKPFVNGDFIVMDDYMGTVENVGLKTTRIRSLGGEQLVISNADLLKSRLRNYKRMQERRVVFTFGVLYQTTPQQLEQIPGDIRSIIEGLQKTRFDRAHFFKFGESSLDFEVVYWMLSADYNEYMDVQQKINLAIVRSFADNGIGFAYPTRSVYIEAPGIMRPVSAEETRSARAARNELRTQ